MYMFFTADNVNHLHKKEKKKKKKKYMKRVKKQLFADRLIDWFF